MAKRKKPSAALADDDLDLIVDWAGGAMLRNGLTAREMLWDDELRNLCSMVLAAKARLDLKDRRQVSAADAPANEVPA